MTKKEIIAANKANVCVGKSRRGYGRTYFAKRNFKRGETVMRGFGKIIGRQTPRLSVQIGFKRHYLPEKWTGRNWNHSCEPNASVKTRKDGFPDLVAARAIKKGEEITLAYWMTEFSWAKCANERRIKCRCGSNKCRGKILAFSELEKREQENLADRNVVSDYLKKFCRQGAKPTLQERN